MWVYSDAARDDEVAGMAWEIILDDGSEVTGKRYLHGDYTSMEAEYYAMLDGLRYALREEHEIVKVRTDCEPLVEKMRVPDGYSQTWYDRRRGCHRLLNKFESWEMKWTPRSSNTNADRLAYEALEEGREAL